MGINEKLASLTAEQSKALAAAMNAQYDKQPDTDNTDQDDKNGDKNGKVTQKTE